MAFTLRQLQFFVAAAEQCSVTGAARSLSISQSSVTEAIRSLEEDLGVTLFERRTRGLVITHKGNLFLRHAIQILADVANARMGFKEDNERETGELFFGATPLVSGYCLAELFSRFRRAYPEITLNALEESGENLLHLLIGGELDLALMLASSIGDQKAAMNMETLLVSPFRLWLPAAHALTKAEAVSLEALSGENLIALKIDEMEESTKHLMQALPVKPRTVFRTGSVEAVRSLVATGGGIAILPNLVYRPWSLEGNRIDIRDVSGDLPSVQVALVWRKGSPLPKPASNFIKVAQAAMAVR